VVGVRIARHSGQTVEVLEGLAVGAHVVVEGAAALVAELSR
jgi:hypothetical protein